MKNNLTKISLFLITISILASFVLINTNTNAATNTNSKKPTLKDTQEMLNTTAQYAGVQRTTSVTDIAVTIVQTILGLVGLVFVILIIYGGFKWMTAGGNDQKVAEAKKLIVNSVIGLLIIMSAFGISVFITNAIEGAG